LGVGVGAAGLEELFLRCNNTTPLLRVIGAVEARICDNKLVDWGRIDIRLTSDHIIRYSAT